MRLKTEQVVKDDNHNKLDFPVVVLYNDTKDLIKGEAKDLIADSGVVNCAKTIISALRSDGVEVIDLPFDGYIESVLVPYPPSRTVIFNLGEGSAGKIFEESRIAWVLEVMGYSFTGSGGGAIARSTNKALAKSLLKRAGLKTPNWHVFSSTEEVLDAQFQGIEFPLIVKPVAEDGSIGLTGSAVVHNEDHLISRVNYVIERYHQLALAEEFIVGREINVAILGEPPEVLPIAEIDFSDFNNPYEKIVSFNAKWVEDSFEYNHTPSICPADLPSSLSARIKNMAIKAWEVIGCSGYARVDFRLDENNIPYIVEVNCNPDISPHAGFYNAVRAAGYTYKNMIYQILNNAWRRSDDYRQNRSNRTWTSYSKNFRKSKSFHQN